MSDTTFLFFFNDTATTEIYTLSLHDALPISTGSTRRSSSTPSAARSLWGAGPPAGCSPRRFTATVTRSPRSEEHTSEFQSRQYLVCRLLLEKKKKNN